MWDPHQTMMIVPLKTHGLQTLEQVRTFLVGNQPLTFEAPSLDTAYDWIASEPRRLGYIARAKQARASPGATFAR